MVSARLMRSKKAKKKKKQAKPYQRPAIIYEGMISTRTGSVPTGVTPEDGDRSVDPADLFGDNG